MGCLETHSTSQETQTEDKGTDTQVDFSSNTRFLNKHSTCFCRRALFSVDRVLQQPIALVKAPTLTQNQKKQDDCITTNSFSTEQQTTDNNQNSHHIDQYNHFIS